MIIYDLGCEHGHRFEGWFHDAGEIAVQRQQGILRCPQCDSPHVDRLPSAINIARQRRIEPPDARGAITSSGSEMAIPAPQATGNTQMLGLYRQFAQAMLAISEDVGNAFAEEARRMHYSRAPKRPIRGEASDDEFAALEDEGIAVMRLPAIGEEDLN